MRFSCRPPTHSASGSSWSKTYAALVPSKENQSRFLRPGETWLATTEPVAPRSVSNRTAAPSSVRTCAVPPVPAALGEGVGHARNQPGDAVTGGELHQVAPVDPDVAEGTGAAALPGSTRQLVSSLLASQSCR